jgi:hypothetical protein
MLLSFLVCAKRTIKWHEIQGAQSLDLSSRDCNFHERSFRLDAKDLCGSLVEVRPNGTVELVHTTAKVYVIIPELNVLSKSDSTGISYLLKADRIRIYEEEVKFSLMCLKYLTFPCFDDNASDADIKKMIWTGDYALADYAIIHWVDHLRVVLEKEILDKQVVSDLKECVHAFLSSRLGPHSNSEWAPDAIKKDVQALDRQAAWEKISKIAIDCQGQRNNEFEESSDSNDKDDTNQVDPGLDKTLLRVRSILYDLSNDLSNTFSLEKMYGKNMYKCSRTDCESFFKGFASIHDLRNHEENHDRICCVFEGCGTTFAGKLRRRQYAKHIEAKHLQQDEDVFPEAVCQSFIGGLKEAIQDRDQKTVESMIVQGWKPTEAEKESATKHGIPLQNQNSRPLFGGVYASARSDRLRYGWADEAWKQAVKDPDKDMIRCLAGLTTFEGTYAQACILKHATSFGRRDIVDHFTADEYFRGTGGHSKIPWDEAIKTAIKRDDGETLKLLVDAALRNPVIGLKKFDDDKLRNFCLIACRAGAFSCVRYFVDGHCVDPFSSKTRSLKQDLNNPIPPTWKNKAVKRESAETLWNKRSVLFQAVMMGHQHIVAYLQQILVGNVFSIPNSGERLIEVAVVNGHDKILQILAEADSLDDSTLNQYQALSKLHNAIQTGKEHYANLLIQKFDPLDLPDRNFCTPLIYAAKHGMEEVAKHLILNGVNVDQLGMPTDVSRFGKIFRAKDVAKGSIYDLLQEVSAD